MSYISEDVRGQVVALEARDKDIAKRLRRLWVGCLVLVLSAMAMNFIAVYLGPDAHPSSIDSPKVKMSFFNTGERGVTSDTPAGWYVLAQVALAAGETSNEWEAFINADGASKITVPNPGFVPRTEILYAIEKAVYGKPVSAKAVAYQNERLTRQRTAKIGATVLAGLSAAVGSVTLCFLAIRHSIRRRVRRIHSLLAEARA